MCAAKCVFLSYLNIHFVNPNICVSMHTLRHVHTCHRSSSETLNVISNNDIAETNVEYDWRNPAKILRVLSLTSHLTNSMLTNWILFCTYRSHAINKSRFCAQSACFMETKIYKFLSRTSFIRFIYFCEKWKSRAFFFLLNNILKFGIRSRSSNNTFTKVLVF